MDHFPSIRPGLHRVAEFVGKQPSAGRAVGLVLVGAKENILADRKCTSVNGCGSGRRSAIGVDSRPSQIAAELRLEGLSCLFIEGKTLSGP
jgi:hypothetical protein